MITCIKYICIITHIHGYALNVVSQTSSLFTTFTVSNSFQLLADLPNDSSIIPSVPVPSRGPQCTSSPKKRSNTHDKKKLCKQRGRSNPLKIINLNFQSLRNKIAQFQALLEIEKPDIVVEQRLGSTIQFSPVNSCPQHTKFSVEIVKRVQLAVEYYLPSIQT